MPKNKFTKLLLWLGIVIALVFVCAAYWIYFKPSKVIFNDTHHVFKAIPADVPFCIQVASLVQLEKLKNQLPDLFFTAPVFEKLLNNQLNLKKHLRSCNATALAKKPFIVAFAVTGKDALAPLLIMPIDFNHTQQAMVKLVGSYVHTESVQQRSYNGLSLFSGVTSSGNTLFWATANDLFLLTNHSVVLEEALRQLSNLHIQPNESFTQTRLNNGNAGVLNLSINHAALSRLANLIPSTLKKELSPFFLPGVDKLIEVLNAYATTSNLTILPQETGCYFSGFINATPFTNDNGGFWNIWQRQKPGVITIHQALPITTVAATFWRCSNYHLFMSRFVTYLKNTNQLRGRDERLKLYQQQTNIPVAQLFEDLVHKQLALAVASVAGNPLKFYTLLAVKVKLRAHNKNRLLTLIKLANHTYTENDLKNKPCRFPLPDLAPVLWGRAFASAKMTYVMQYKQQLLFAHDSAVLHQLVREIKQNGSLAKNSYYHKFLKKMPHKANLRVFVNNEQLFFAAHYLLESNPNWFVTQNAAIWQLLGAAGWQLATHKNNNNNLRVTAYCNYRFSPKQQTHTAVPAFAAPLKYQLLKEPALTIVAANKQQKNLLVQDAQFNLYLLDSKGLIIWTMPLKEPILGKVYQVDYLRNGKLQYLFNTSNYLWLIDKNGDVVQPSYPKPLPSKAVLGMLLVAEPRQGQPKIFVACTDKKIYAYDLQARLLTNWTPPVLNETISQPLQYTRFGKGLTILAQTQQQLYLFNASGKNITPWQSNPELSNNMVHLTKNSTKSNYLLYYSNVKGNIHALLKTGADTLLITHKMPPTHLFYALPWGHNNTQCFVVASSKKLVVISENQKTLFVKRFPYQITALTSVTLHNREWLMVTVRNNQRVYLINADGFVHQATPLNGTGGFTLGALNGTRNCIITGNKHKQLVGYFIE